MKKKFLWALVCAAAFMTTACGNDDEPDMPPIGDEWIDPEFAMALEEYGYISDADSVTPADVADITEIDICSCELTSLRGIQYFIALETLDCRWNEVASLDVSGNTKLTTLLCSYNELKSLDLSKNTKLEILHCNHNAFTGLDVSKNTELGVLYCDNNNLTSLDVSNNTKLTNLHCFKNALTGLDISKCKEMIHLECKENPGKNGDFTVKAWFNNSNIPYLWGNDFTTGTWTYNGQTVKINYVKVEQ